MESGRPVEPDPPLEGRDDVNLSDRVGFLYHCVYAYNHIKRLFFNFSLFIKATNGKIVGAF